MDLDDFSKVMLIGPPKLRFDGKFIAFRAGKADLDKDMYDYRIWGLNADGKPIPLTEGPKDGDPSWEPKGNRFIFIRKGDNGDELVMFTPGGEKITVFRWRNGISRAEWASEKASVATLNEGDKEEDVKIVRTIPFWRNGRGWTYWYLSRLYGIDLSTGETWPISPDGIHVKDFMPSPDGKRVAFLALKDRSKPLDVSLFVGSLDGSDVYEIGPGNWFLLFVSWGRDGKSLGIVGHDKRRGLATNEHLYETPIDEWEPDDRSPIDRSLGNSLNSDVRGGSDHRPKWMDGKWYFTIHDGTAVHLYASGDSLTPVIKENVSIEGFDARAGRIVLSIMKVNEPAEIYELADGLVKLTTFNDGFKERVKVPRPEKFSFLASDGVEIEGFYLKPENGNPPFPAILYVHGGPATAFGHAFMHELYLLRDKGYAVIFTNPRGSEGYGEEFRDIRRHYGERDYLDLMEAVDEAIRRGIADPNRLAVMGGSYGGFMTNWIIGHTDRFKAAVTMRSISDWISDYGTTDIGFFFNPEHIGGTPWENFQAYWEKSPIAYVDRVKTPTLIIHSLDDYRCWLSQALELFTALKVRGVDTELVLFPDEDHDLSRKGKPKHRVFRLKKILEWLDSHLKQ